MNSTRDFVRSSLSGTTVPRAFPAFPRASSLTVTRAGLPVVSNRAFISAWATRRDKLVAAAHVARSY